MAIDRWTCNTCGWVYEGRCRPHEAFGWTIEEVGAHQWERHQSVAASGEDGVWLHINGVSISSPPMPPWPFRLDTGFKIDKVGAPGNWHPVEPPFVVPEDGWYWPEQRANGTWTLVQVPAPFPVA